MKPTPPVGTIAAAVVVLIASFLPWGSFAGSAGGGFFGGMRVTFTMNAWNGTVGLMDMPVPHWLAVVVAVAIAVIAALKAYDVWVAHPAVNVLLACYGVLHLGLTVLLLGARGSVGVGSIVTLACFIALLVLAVKAMKQGSPSDGVVAGGT